MRTAPVLLHFFALFGHRGRTGFFLISLCIGRVLASAAQVLLFTGPRRRRFTDNKPRKAIQNVLDLTL